MKTLLTILILLIFGQNCFTQISRIDSLINQLDNSQVGLNGDYSGATIDLRGEPSISICDIGRPATEKLIAILEDSSKGIISHILLTWIWKKTQSPKTIFIEKDNLSVYTYNDLNFFVRPGRIYANQYDLRLNRSRWEALIRQNEPLTRLSCKSWGNESTIHIKSLINPGSVSTINALHQFLIQLIN